MKNTFILSFFVLLSFYCSGQSQLGNMDSNPNPTYMTSTAGIYINNHSGERMSKLFLFKDFNNQAIIFDVDDKPYKISNFNIDLTSNKFVSSFSKDSLYTFDKIEKVIINNHVYLNRDNKIYEVISDGDKMNVMLRYFAKEKEEIRDKLNGKILKPKHFVTRKEYDFINKLDNTKKTISRLKKKSMASLFSEQYKKRMSSYIKVNKLSIRDKTDLKSIFDYYNAL